MRVASYDTWDVWQARRDPMHGLKVLDRERHSCDYDHDWNGDDWEATQLPMTPWQAMILELAKG